MNVPINNFQNIFGLLLFSCLATVVFASGPVVNCHILESPFFSQILYIAQKYHVDTTGIDTLNCSDNYSLKQINELNKQLSTRVFSKVTCFKYVFIGYKDSNSVDKFTFMHCMEFSPLDFQEVKKEFIGFKRNYFTSEVWNRFQCFYCKNTVVLIGSLFSPNDPLFTECLDRLKNLLR